MVTYVYYQSHNKIIVEKRKFDISWWRARGDLNPGSPAVFHVLPGGLRIYRLIRRLESVLGYGPYIG